MVFVNAKRSDCYLVLSGHDIVIGYVMSPSRNFVEAGVAAIRCVDRDQIYVDHHLMWTIPLPPGQNACFESLLDLFYCGHCLRGPPYSNGRWFSPLFK